MSDQFVYFIQADESGPIKIGYTADDPKKRLGQLQTGNPATLKLLGAIKGSTADERRFHAELSEWRLQGEWFEPHPTVIEAVENALEATSEPETCGGPYCSFCGVCKHDAAVLIAGFDDTFICESCVSTCAKIASEHLLNAAKNLCAASCPEMGYGG